MQKWSGEVETSIDTFTLANYENYLTFGDDQANRVIKFWKGENVENSVCLPVTWERTISIVWPKIASNSSLTVDAQWWGWCWRARTFWLTLLFTVHRCRLPRHVNWCYRQYGQSMIRDGLRSREWPASPNGHTRDVPLLNCFKLEKRHDRYCHYVQQGDLFLLLTLDLHLFPVPYQLTCRRAASFIVIILLVITMGLYNELLEG